MDEYRENQPAVITKSSDKPLAEKMPVTIDSNQEQDQAEASLKQLKEAFGPVLPGIFIDLVDFVTFGPIGLFIGMILGGLGGYWIGSEHTLSMKKRLLLSLIAGAYCTLPLTGFLPVGTILGASVAWFRFHELSEKKREGRADKPENEDSVCKLD